MKVTRRNCFEKSPLAINYIKEAPHRWQKSRLYHKENNYDKDVEGDKG